MIRRLALFLAALVCFFAPALAASAAAELRELLAARLLLMEDVARSKWSTGAPIDDPERERFLLEAGVVAAAQEGLAADAVATLFRAQIEAAKMVQRRLFARWRAEGRAAFPNAEGLLAARRPEIAQLTAQIVPAYALARDQLAACAAREELGEVPAALAEDAAAWRLAVRGVTAGLGPCH